MLAGLRAGNDMLGMQPARRQHRNRVDILAGKKVVDVVAGRHRELRGDRIGTRADRIAYGGERSAGNVIAAQQIRVTLGDAPAAEQAKSDHRNFLFGTAGPCANGPRRTQGGSCLYSQKSLSIKSIGSWASLRKRQASGERHRFKGARQRIFSSEPIPAAGKREKR